MNKSRSSFCIFFYLVSLLLVSGCGSHTLVATDPTLNSTSEPGSWQIYGYDLGNSLFPPEDMPVPQGEIVWEYDHGDSISTMPLFKDNVLYVLYGVTCTLVALDADTGTEVWTRQLDPRCSYARALSLAGDQVYVSIDGILREDNEEFSPVVYALDKDTGEVLWQQQTYSSWPFYVLQGIGYQISAVTAATILEQKHPVLEIRDATTGEKLKELTLSFIQSPRVDMILFDTLHIYLQQGESIYAIDRKTYTQVWERHIAGLRGGTRLFEDKLYVSGDETILVLDPQDGTELLRLANTNSWGGPKGSISAVAYDLILTRRREDPAKPGTFYALNMNQGTLQWQHPLNDHATTMVVANGRVYFGTTFVGEEELRGKVYSLDIITGDLMWALDTPAMKFFPPIIVNGTLYVGSYTGEVLAIN